MVRIIAVLFALSLDLSVGANAKPADKNGAEFEAAKKAVSYGMKDPGSTQFRNMRFGGNNHVFVCGEVNAKNSFGAYIGFTPFYFDSSTGEATIYSSSSEDAAFTEIKINMLCK